MPIIKKRNTSKPKKAISQTSGKSVTHKKDGEEIEGENNMNVMENRPSTIMQGEVRLGLSSGVTLNMGNYESVRVSAWIERVVEDNTRERNKAVTEMGEFLDEVLNAHIEDLRNSN